MDRLGSVGLLMGLMIIKQGEKVRKGMKALLRKGGPIILLFCLYTTSNALSKPRFVLFDPGEERVVDYSRYGTLN